MKISDCMKRKVISASKDISVRQAVQILVSNHIGTLPIIDENSTLVGLIRARDLLTLAFPDFVTMFENIDFIHDFGIIENEKPEPEILSRSVIEIMGDPFCVESDSGLVRAITVLQEHKLNDLPVVDENKNLVGIASAVDIAVAIMANWE